MMLVPLRHRQERQNNCNSSNEFGHRSQKPLELCYSCTDETLLWDLFGNETVQLCPDENDWADKIRTIMVTTCMQRKSPL